MSVEAAPVSSVQVQTAKRPNNEWKRLLSADFETVITKLTRAVEK
jgi:hypothetical protein